MEGLELEKEKGGEETNSIALTYSNTHSRAKRKGTFQLYSKLKGAVHPPSEDNKECDNNKDGDAAQPL